MAGKEKKDKKSGKGKSGKKRKDGKKSKSVAKVKTARPDKSTIPAAVAAPAAIHAAERSRMIAEAAYYRSLARGHDTGSPEQDWIEAEREIDCRYPAKGKPAL